MNWKIVSLVLFILLVLETSFIIWAVNAGNEMIENEYECSINVCGIYDAYTFDEYNNICSCYKGNKIVLTKLIK